MSQDLQLVLVDLDNLITGRRLPFPMPSTAPGDDYGWLNSTGESLAGGIEGVPCVVVFAMNLHTAGAPGVSYDNLADLAARFSRLLANAPLRGIEIALTLPIKQSADKALERLVRQSPLREHAGPVVGASLVSSDEGLRQSVGQILGRFFVRTSVDVRNASSWSRIDSKPARRKGLRRSPPKLGPPTIVAALTGSPSPNALVDTPALAAWARHQDVDLPHACTMFELSGELSARPGVLTQLGLTQSSLQGLVRMSRLAAGELPQIEDCGPLDGLEIGVAQLAPGDYFQAEPSALGPGAVRFRQPAGTATTLLPAAVFSALTAAVYVRRDAAVDDKGLVRQLPAGVACGGAPFKVAFELKQRVMHVEVRGLHGQPLPGWWWLGLDTTASHRRIEFKTAAQPLMSPLKEVDALCGVIPGKWRHVGPIAPLDGTFDATPLDAISPGTLGRAIGGDVEFALLADEDASLPSGASVRCKRIQLLTNLEWRRKYPKLRAYADDLHHLPIVVPA